MNINKRYAVRTTRETPETITSITITSGRRFLYHHTTPSKEDDRITLYLYGVWVFISNYLGLKLIFENLIFIQYSYVRLRRNFSSLHSDDHHNSTSSSASAPVFTLMFQTGRLPLRMYNQGFETCDVVHTGKKKDDTDRE